MSTIPVVLDMSVKAEQTSDEPLSGRVTVTHVYHYEGMSVDDAVAAVLGVTS